MAKIKIMVVEDESITARDLQLTLEELGYAVCARVSGGEEAMEQAAATRPDLALMDIMLAGALDGIETAQQLGEQFDIPVVYLTAHANGDTVSRAARSAPYGFVVKPFNEKDLRSNIEIALYKASMERQVRESQSRLQRNLRGMIDLVSGLIRMHDSRRASDDEKVRLLACAIARQLGLAADAVEGLELSARVMGLGLMSVPSAILAQRDRLSGPALQIYREHPRIAHDLLKGLDFAWPIAQIVLQHQERLDGSGYPAGLKGDAIMLEARILAVAEAVVAMTTDQQQKAARGMDYALNQIAQESGKLYDPEVVDACLHLIQDKGYALSGGVG